MPVVDHLTRLVRDMRWRALGVLLLLGATGLLEGTGLLLLIPLLNAIGLEVQQGSIGRLATFVSNVFGLAGLTPTLPLVLGVFFVVNALLALLRRTQTLLSSSFERRMSLANLQRLYAAIARMDWLSFSRLRGSDLTIALTGGHERVGLAASHVLMLGASLVVTLVYIVLAFRISPGMTAGVFGGGVVLLLVMRHRTTRARTLGATFSEKLHEYQAAIADDLAGMKTIRSFVAEARSRDRISLLAARVATARHNNIRNYANSTFWLDVGSIGVLSTLVFVAVSRFRFDASALLLLLFLFARVVPRLASLQQNIEFYVSLLPGLERQEALVRACEAAADRAVDDGPPVHLRQSIALDGVSFRYGPGIPNVLSDMSFTVEAGSTVAIVGPSGAGKTTVVDVMLGLLKPEAGSIVVDDAPLDPMSGTRWRRSIAYVPQDTFLFHDTVRANLRWAVPESSDEQLMRALSMAAADFALDLPQGLDTIVGDRGVRLSGGERQRIALARALLRQPTLLILDEATSALDSENETRIFDAIQRLHGRMTIVIITHRVSTVANADVIHVMDNGRLVESGSWDALIARSGGRFRELCRAQGVPLTSIPSTP